MAVAHENHPTPPPKMPEHHSTDKNRSTKEDKIDAQMEDSFPASDPPSYSGGNHAVGAPTGRESEAPGAERKLNDDASKDSGKH